MNKLEVLGCLREAAEALGDLSQLLPRHSEAAQAQVDMARQHLEYAVTLLAKVVEVAGPAFMRLAE